MGGAVIIGFVNIFIFVVLIISVYNALRKKRGIVFNISRWLMNLISRMQAVVTRTPVRKYGSMCFFVVAAVIYILHQKGIVGMHLL